MKQWLQKTHGPLFELLRHFLLRFFDSDLITAPGQMTAALVGAFSIFIPCFPIILAPVRAKYMYISKLGNPSLYESALRADELWLMTLVMSATGLLTAIKWNSVFPGLRDYRSLASLPLRPAQLFMAKMLALLLVAMPVILILNLFPSVMFPSISGSPWSTASWGQRVVAQALAGIAGSYFLFFGLVAVQGMLLIVLRPRTFNSVTGYLQGFLVAAMLVFTVLSFSIQPSVASSVLQPSLAQWLPPAWFLGLQQTLLGNPDSQLRSLAHLSIAALLLALFSTFIAYMLSYHRYRRILLEVGPTSVGRRRFAVLGWLIPNPRQQAVVSFIMKTLTVSSQHRLILMGYTGFGLAVLLTGLLSLKQFVPPSRMLAAGFVYTHVVITIFVLVGFRHLFSIPLELRANWIFRITEEEGRREWLAAVDRFVLVAGMTAFLVIPFPIEFRVIGWRAVGESILLAAFGLLCYELVFYSWEKLPFTCSHLPGKFPMWIRALQVFGVLGLLAPVNAILLGCLYSRPRYTFVLALLLVSWAFVRTNRMNARGVLHLKYEESPEAPVLSLRLLQ